MVWHVCGSQRTNCGNQFSSLVMLVPGIGFRLSTWWQAPLSTEPPYWLIFVYFSGLKFELRVLYILDKCFPKVGY